MFDNLLCQHEGLYRDSIIVYDKSARRVYSVPWWGELCENLEVLQYYTDDHVREPEEVVDFLRRRGALLELLALGIANATLTNQLQIELGAFLKG